MEDRKEANTLDIEDIEYAPKSQFGNQILKGSIATDYEFNQTKEEQSFVQFIFQQNQDGRITRKSLKLSIFLCLVSITLFFFGLYEETHEIDPINGLSFFILAFLSGTPGFYVFYILRKAYLAPPGSSKRS